MTETRDVEGRSNGWLKTIWDDLGSPYRVRQIYAIGVAPHSRKGPHLHMERTGMLACVVGSVRVRQRVTGGYVDTVLGIHDGPFMLSAGTPAAIYNEADVEAILINMPDRPWAKENPDDHPVEDWED